MTRSQWNLSIFPARRKLIDFHFYLIFNPIRIDFEASRRWQNGESGSKTIVKLRVRDVSLSSRLSENAHSLIRTQTSAIQLHAVSQFGISSSSEPEHHIRPSFIIIKQLAHILHVSPSFFLLFSTEFQFGMDETFGYIANYTHVRSHAMPYVHVCRNPFHYHIQQQIVLQTRRVARNAK